MELLIILLLVLLNGVLSMSEMAIVSSRKARLQHWAEAGDAKAQVALELARQPGHFLSTIQVGITLVGIMSGAFGEATLAAPLAQWLQQFGALAQYSQQAAFGIVVAFITVLSLILGELVPKRLALLHPERIAALVAVPMRLLSAAAYPIVRVLSATTDLMLRLLRARPSEQPPITEEEIKVLVEQGTEAGVFKESEEELITNVFELDEPGIGALMTPRPDITFIDVDAGINENLKRINDSKHSLFPVCKGGIDHVLGMVRNKDLLTRCLTAAPLDFAAVLSKPLYVPESISGMDLLKTFKRSPLQGALVIDEYGEIQGLVTLNDVFQALVGDIPSFAPGEEQLATRREDGSWLFDGMLPIDDLKKLLEITELPGEESNAYNTLAGFIMMHLGRVPAVADHFEWNGLRFEVVDMDRARIDKVLVAPSAGGSGMKPPAPDVPD
jgi:putative hemolysin